MRPAHAATAFVLAALVAMPAAARTARCVVRSPGTPTWRGPCDFVSDGPGGTFAIIPLRGRFPGGADDIGVAIISPGVAEVRGSTPDGINSRWGEARRSRRDPACWVGSDFSVCVY